MTVLYIYVCLALFTSGAFGSFGAGPYQTVLYFLTYRMSVDAFGVGNTVIANGCRGSVGDSSCYFDEFIREISPQWTGSTSVGTDLDPPVESTVQDLVNNGNYDYIERQDLLFPLDPATFPKKRKAPFGTVFNAVGNRIEAARMKFGDIQLGPLLNKCRYTMSMIHDARRAENAAALIRELNAEIQKRRIAGGKNAFQAKTRTVRISNGNSWEEVDAQETLDLCKSEGCRQKMIDSIRDMINNFNSNAKTGQGSSHYEAIKATELEEDRLYRAPGC